MNFIRQIERLQCLNHLIKNECTGTPDELAERLSLKKSQLYETLDVLKIYGAPVKYRRKLKTFYYENDWSMEINLKVKILTQNEEQKIYGGVIKNFFKIAFPSDFFGRKEISFAPANQY
jgi:predicted transcriptional regulator